MYDANNFFSKIATTFHFIILFVSFRFLLSINWKKGIYMHIAKFVFHCNLIIQYITKKLFCLFKSLLFLPLSNVLFLYNPLFMVKVILNGKNYILKKLFSNRKYCKYDRRYCKKRKEVLVEHKAANNEE